MEKELKKGLFFCLEGPEGSGKSTHVRNLAQELAKEGYVANYTHEPGATHIGCRIRDMLLKDEKAEVFPETELLLFEADRAQHVREVIKPSLDSKNIIISDRYSLATLAYQGYGLNLSVEKILEIDRFATGGLYPDLTVILDLDVETGLDRAGGVENADKMEKRGSVFHRRVREAYRKLAEKDPDRIKVVEVKETIEETYSTIRSMFYEKVERYKRTG